MTGLDGKSLLSLGLRYTPNRVWTGSHYRTRNLVVLEDLRVGHWCESSDGSTQWFIEVMTTTLSDMGLQREEKTFKVTKKDV